MKSGGSFHRYVTVYQRVVGDLTNGTGFINGDEWGMRMGDAAFKKGTGDFWGILMSVFGSMLPLGK